MQMVFMVFIIGNKLGYVVCRLTIPMREKLFYHLETVHRQGGHQSDVSRVRGRIRLVVKEEEVGSVVSVPCSPELVALIFFTQLP